MTQPGCCATISPEKESERRENMEHCSNTALFMEKFRLLLENGQEMPLPVQGSSMAPFLVDRRDMVWLRSPAERLKTGDIVLYQRENGQYILHRIHSVQDGTFTLVGDGHHVLEPGIRREQIFGQVVRAWRKDRNQQPGSFCWEFFARVWIRMIPLRPLILSVYSGFKKVFGRNQ